MKKILLALLTSININCQSQKIDRYNLGFENQKDEQVLSEGWFKWGNYELMIDNFAHSGKKSGKITSDSIGSSFGSIAYKIPANSKGSTIKLEGVMKIKNVTNNKSQKGINSYNTDFNSQYIFKSVLFIQKTVKQDYKKE